MAAAANPTTSELFESNYDVELNRAYQNLKQAEIEANEYKKFAQQIRSQIQEIIKNDKNIYDTTIRSQQLSCFTDQVKLFQQVGPLIARRAEITKRLIAAISDL